MRMRHPRLRTVIDVPDDDHTIAVHRDGGWIEEPEPVQHHPGLAPGEPAPEPDTPEPAAARSKRPKTGTDDATPSP